MMSMERRSGSSNRPTRMQMAAEERKRQRRRRATTPPGYFPVELVAVFLCVTASLVFLPLVLPPLPPPPSLLLAVPVCLLAVLVAMAFVPLDAHSNVVASSSL
ncbi:hypothetical protein ABZP36_028004 [Zizania latifolia]